jgi:hypothetical protein
VWGHVLVKISLWAQRLLSHSCGLLLTARNIRRRRYYYFLSDGIAELRALCADQSEHLAAMPQTWSAADVSDLLCGRPDMPIYASMFSCLYKEIFDSTEEPAAVKWLRSSEPPLVAEAAATASLKCLSRHDNSAMTDYRGVVMA